MEIRQLSLSDIELNRNVICELITQCLDTIQSKNISAQEKFEKLMFHVENGTGYAFGATEDQRLCGFCWVYPYETEQGLELHIAYLAVDVKYREQGIGKSLILHCEKFARENNIFTIGLNVATDNIKATSLYLNCGMKSQTVHFYKEL